MSGKYNDPMEGRCILCGGIAMPDSQLCGFCDELREQMIRKRKRRDEQDHARK